MKGSAKDFWSLFRTVSADEGHGIVKFKGEVISAPCSIKPGDEDLTVNLGEVADTVLKSDQKSYSQPERKRCP
ncbi:hypothetical protein ACUOFC_63105, partial [Escherichia sp. TWPC-MK]